ncbi:hypothetical protein [Streptomyces sp. NPDC057579]|uniref:hypothetical protein n=1 Tax=Streptomyces sp. NPDC057579 TaxID=3346172 RepID=UPI0036CC3EF7
MGHLQLTSLGPVGTALGEQRDTERSPDTGDRDQYRTDIHPITLTAIPAGAVGTRCERGRRLAGNDGFLQAERAVQRLRELRDSPYDVGSD